jgi:uncharacterized protein (TIGR03000 family)
MRKALPLSCLLLIVAMLAPGWGQGPGSRQAAYLRVLLPDKDAELLIDGVRTKQTGASRRFVSPPLDRARTFTYTVTARWEPNNYTTVIRTRPARVQAGQEIEIDLRKADPNHPDRFVIRYVPTPDEVIEAMCKLAKVGTGDVVYDLGCGDGRILISAIKDFGAKRGVGVDLDPERIKESWANAKKEGLTNRLEFRQGDVLNIKDLREATVVMLYMGEDVNLRLRPILKKTLRPGARIVSHDFPMGDWKPEKTVQITDFLGEDHDVHLWTIRPGVAPPDGPQPARPK